MDRAIEAALRRLKEDPADRSAAEELEGLCIRAGCPRPLLYHGALAESLSWRPRIDSGRLAWIREREESLALALPLALREWLSLEGSETLFDFSPSAEPMPLERWGEHLLLLKKRDGRARSVLALDGAADPPVRSLEGADGRRLAERFSGFAARFVRASLRAYGRRNAGSWAFIRGLFTEMYSSNAHLAIDRVLDLIDRGAARSDAARFHPGSSLYHLVISTTSYYGLSDADLAFAVIPWSEGRLGITTVDGASDAMDFVADQDEARLLFDLRLAELWQRSRGLDLPSAVFEGGDQEPYPF